MKPKPKKVQAPEGCSNYLTPGKIYDVIGFWDEGTGQRGYRFSIVANNGYIANCTELGCVHLNGQDWIVIETETENIPKSEEEKAIELLKSKGYKILKPALEFKEI